MLTEKELQQIKDEAEKLYPDVLIEERGIMELHEMYEHNDMQGCARAAYIAALTKERERTKGLVEGIEILKELCQLKHYKDSVGKDTFYEKKQPELWKLANEFLNNYQNSTP